MEQKELDTILQEQAKWLNNDGGKRAYLEGADLRGADLRGANLRGANLEGAYLEGATYGKGITIEKIPIQIMGFKYHVLILDTHIKIGCNLAPISDWIANGDSLIPDDDRELWQAYKPALIAVLKAAVRI